VETADLDKDEWLVNS